MMPMYSYCLLHRVYIYVKNFLNLLKISEIRFYSIRHITLFRELQKIINSLNSVFSLRGNVF